MNIPVGHRLHDVSQINFTFGDDDGVFNFQLFIEYYSDNSENNGFLSRTASATRI